MHSESRFPIRRPVPNAHVDLENVPGSVLTRAPLAPGPLARDADGNLWGVGTADKRLGLSQYASTSAIVEYDPSGSSRAFLIPPLYTPGYLTVEGPNGRPWSLLWNNGTAAAVVQLNANGSITPEFTIAPSKLPVQHSIIQYARYGKNGIVWLFSNGYPHPRITRWILGSQNPTQISLPARGYLSGGSLTTAPDGSAWVVGKEINGTQGGPTDFYRVSPAGVVTTFTGRASNSRNAGPMTVFWANGSVWGVVAVNFGPNAGDAYLLRVDPGGEVSEAAIPDANGSISQAGPAIVAHGNDAFLTGLSAVPELRFTP